MSSEQLVGQLLPDLEHPCDYCDGDKIVETYRGDENCPQCGGTGFVPTALGQQILDLVEHRSSRAIVPSLRSGT